MWKGLTSEDEGQSPAEGLPSTRDVWRICFSKKWKQGSCIIPIYFFWGGGGVTWRMWNAVLTCFITSPIEKWEIIICNTRDIGGKHERNKQLFLSQTTFSLENDKIITQNPLRDDRRLWGNLLFLGRTGFDGCEAAILGATLAPFKWP